MSQTVFTPADLRAWAESQPEAWPQRAAILALCEENKRMRRLLRFLRFHKCETMCKKCHEAICIAYEKGGES